VGSRRTKEVRRRSLKGKPREKAGQREKDVGEKENDLTPKRKGPKESTEKGGAISQLVDCGWGRKGGVGA